MFNFKKFNKVFNICIDFGICHYDADMGINLYIEFGKLFRKYKYWRGYHYDRSIEFSIFRIDIT